MRSDIDPDVFFLEVFQLRGELDDQGETVTDERLTTTTLDALPEEKRYSTVKMKSVRDPDLGLEEIIGMMKTIFINHSERSSVPKRSKEPYRKARNSGREPRTPCLSTAIQFRLLWCSSGRVVLSDNTLPNSNARCK